MMICSSEPTLYNMSKAPEHGQVRYKYVINIFPSFYTSYNYAENVQSASDKHLTRHLTFNISYT